MDDVFVCRLDGGRTVAVRTRPDRRTGFVMYRVEGRRIGGTYNPCADVLHPSELVAASLSRRHTWEAILAGGEGRADT